MIDQATPTFLPRNRLARAAAARWLARHGYLRPNWPLRIAIMHRLNHAPGPAARLYGAELLEVRDWFGEPPLRHWERKRYTRRMRRR